MEDVRNGDSGEDARSSDGDESENDNEARGGEKEEEGNDDVPMHNQGQTDVSSDDDEAPEKDESEVELERLVFGDSLGFKAAVQEFGLEGGRERAWGGGEETDEDEDEDEEDRGDMNDIPDQDLFFFDSGPVPTPGVKGALVTSTAGEAESEDEDEEEGDGRRQKPAWEDSDDERLVVSLASAPRLRKLRETEAEDVITGKEYVRRLRRQYQRLYPTPEWAVQASGKVGKRKRTRVTESGGEESASDMDVDEEEEEDDLSTQPLARLLKDADILARGTARGPAKRRKLQPGVVTVQRLKDVAKRGPSAITSLSFHPTLPLLLSSGPSSTLSLHHVLPHDLHSPNPLLTSLHLRRTPLTTTAFHPSPSDARIFLSARRRYFHIWNLATGTIEKVSRIYGQQHEQRSMEHFSLSPDGKFMALRGSSRKGGGVVNILDATTLQWVTQVRIESRGGVADFCWWGNGKGMCVVGKNGEVTEWGVEVGVVGRWMDEGAVGTTVIRLGGKSGREDWLGGDRWVAVGSSSGVVNVYDRRAWMEEVHSSKDAKAATTAAADNGNLPTHPKPLRALSNLVTPISHLAFSPDGQILLMASRWKQNALRLVHLPSVTVFKNWPNVKTPLGRITSVAWGRPSEEEEREGCLALLAVGTEMGRIRLWEVRC
ncbi:WD40 repeat-like protein [Westerdykella ornata]|uniref:WD40 repeat-like protein n=1 Tax=Westerdykella ornata TaxID=318751 RepID=A0A6A6J7J6_WESOR|nr:WD40 repeat-like protein [Westerdykella ornata]KAF2272133.1 WD40 repeat-like protein [Westerdykella ornata]